MQNKKQLSAALGEVSKIAVSLHRKKVHNVANDIAKIALDLTNGNDILRISPNGVSIGDRVKCNVPLHRRNTIPKATPGNVVGFDPKTKSYLVLFFPVWFPQGVLVLVNEKEINFLMKPKIEENTELVFTQPEVNQNLPRSAIVRAFFDEILAENGLAVAGEWMNSPGPVNDTGSTYFLRCVVKKAGVKVPRGNKGIARELVDSIVTTLQKEVLPSVKDSGVKNFVDIIDRKSVV